MFNIIRLPYCKNLEFGRIFFKPSVLILSPMRFLFRNIFSFILNWLLIFHTINSSNLLGILNVVQLFPQTTLHTRYNPPRVNLATPLGSSFMTCIIFQDKFGFLFPVFNHPVFTCIDLSPTCFPCVLSVCLYNVIISVDRAWCFLQGTK